MSTVFLYLTYILDDADIVPRRAHYTSIICVYCVFVKEGVDAFKYSIQELYSALSQRAGGSVDPMAQLQGFLKQMGIALPQIK